MSVIIRLQNLPWSANALDIRQYFTGLSIPEGGVHIVGGEQGDAFIAFSTDEDARQAFLRSNGKIKEVQITLMLSSRTEMQKVIEQARNQSYAAFMAPQPTPTPLPAAVPQLAPEIKPKEKEGSKEKDSSDRKRDKKRSRSRSKSRDRTRSKKDRSRDRRRHRDKSRSRSRERRDRRRRDRSRDRSRSRERRNRDDDTRKRSNDRSTSSTATSFQPQKKQMPEIWVNPVKPELVAAQASNLLGTYPITLDQAKLTLNTLTAAASLQVVNTNGFPNANRQNTNSFGLSQRNQTRESWPPQNNALGSFNNRASDNFDNNSRHTQNQRDSMDNGSRRDRNNQFGNKRDNHDYNRDNSSKDAPLNSCVTVEPFYGSYGDIRKFFSGLHISFKGIKVINDQMGHRTGICLVQFASQSQKEQAIRKSSDELNGIAVKIQHITDREFYEAVDRYNPYEEDYAGTNSDIPKFKGRNITKYFNNSQESPKEEIKAFSCLKLEDLPSFVKEQDILHIFAFHPLISMHLTKSTRGGHVAYAKFSSEDAAKKALEEKSSHVVGRKSITVKPCKDEEFDEVNNEHNAELDNAEKNTKTVAEPAVVTETLLETDCLNVTELPLKTTDRDIADFFSDIGVLPTKIHLMSNSFGFTGQALCEFDNASEATKAVTKDKATMGSAKINVVPIKRDDMIAILENTQQMPPNEKPAVQPMPLMAALPLVPAVQGNLNVPPRLGFRPREPNIMRPPFGFRGPPSMGPRFGPRGQMRPRFQHGGSGGNGEEDAQPGCTVYMDNVPYKAGTNEILDFFEGYNCTNNVSRRYNPNNTPSAEAKVTFHSPDEAFKAVQDLNGKKIWERSIYLNQA